MPSKTLFRQALWKLTVQTAWAAGLFEGEGSFTTNVNKWKRYPQASITMTDKDVLDRFAKIMKCGNVNGPYFDKRGKRKPKYIWQAFNKNASKTASMLGPFMCARRVQQIHTMLDKCEAHNAK
jgi:hypothetical protein